MTSSPATLFNLPADEGCPKDLESNLIFLIPDEKHTTQKPYKLQYDPGNDIPRTNTVSELYGPVKIQDLRGCDQSLSFDQNGFCIAELVLDDMNPEDFLDAKKVKQLYYAKLHALLMDLFKPQRVEILEHLIRKRHVEFPISTGGDYDYLQPTSVVHTDFTLKSALDASQDILKVPTNDYNRVQCINLWKPLRGPLTDWPLAVCDERTVDLEADYIASDVVSRTGFTENYLIYFNPKHKWYYLSGQKPTELFLFRQADTRYPDLKGKGFLTAGFKISRAMQQKFPGKVLKPARFYTTDGSNCRTRHGIGKIGIFPLFLVFVKVFIFWYFSLFHFLQQIHKASYTN